MCAVEACVARLRASPCGRDRCGPQWPPWPPHFCCPRRPQMTLKSCGWLLGGIVWCSRLAPLPMGRWHTSPRPRRDPRASGAPSGPVPPVSPSRANVLAGQHGAPGLSGSISLRNGGASSRPWPEKSNADKLDRGSVSGGKVGLAVPWRRVLTASSAGRRPLGSASRRLGVTSSRVVPVPKAQPLRPSAVPVWALIGPRRACR